MTMSGENAGAVDASKLKEALAKRADPVKDYLRGCLKGRSITCKLLESMEYSLGAGGKRIRPVLCVATAELFGQPEDSVLPFAGGLELIHTYSLVHDDLPAMDDDDLRRGKPSNHKMFGEAMAILAGDGLLTEAFALMAETAGSLPAANVARAIGEVARAAGPAGMVGGQALDMMYTGQEGVTLTQLQDMHARKTGALIVCSCVSGAILADAGDADVERIREYGRHVGAAFQIADDILDVVGDEQALGKPVGSDEGQGKNTYPSMLGLEKSRELALERADQAVESIAPYTGAAADFLRNLARYVVERAC